jgi:hypothetical protein
MNSLVARFGEVINGVSASQNYFAWHTELAKQERGAYWLSHHERIDCSSFRYRPSWRAKRIIDRISMSVVLDVAEYCALVDRVVAHLHQQPSGPVCRAISPSTRQRGHYFRGKWTFPLWLCYGDICSDAALNEGLAFSGYKGNKSSVDYWELFWDRQRAEGPVSWIAAQCKCKKRIGVYEYFTGREIEFFCFACYMKLCKIAKQEAAILNNKSLINQIKKEIKNVIKNQNDGRSAGISGQHDDRREERRFENSGSESDQQACISG